jgi:hypothetical protein
MNVQEKRPLKNLRFSNHERIGAATGSQYSSVLTLFEMLVTLTRRGCCLPAVREGIFGSRATRNFA